MNVSLLQFKFEILVANLGLSKKSTSTSHSVIANCCQVDNKWLTPRKKPLIESVAFTTLI